jgi:hypothetical protein
MEFSEIYCNDCKKVLARYNVKYYSEDMIAELIQTIHVIHTRGGHHIKIHKKKIWVELKFNVNQMSLLNHLTNLFGACLVFLEY